MADGARLNAVSFNQDSFALRLTCRTKIQRSRDEVCLTSQFLGSEMDSSSDDRLARLLRLKRYERPPPGYFENFLHEFRRRRQRDELLRRPLWRMCFESARDFALRLDVRPWVFASAAAVFACAAVISLTIDRQPDTTQLAVQASPIPSALPITEKQLDFAPPVFNATFNMEPSLLRERRHVRVLPVDSLRSDQPLLFKLEWESLDDQQRLDR